MTIEPTVGQSYSIVAYGKNYIMTVTEINAGVIRGQVYETKDGVRKGELSNENYATYLSSFKDSFNAKPIITDWKTLIQNII